MRGFEVIARRVPLTRHWAALVDVDDEIRTILDGETLVVWDIGAAWGLPPHLLTLQRIAEFHLVEPNSAAANGLRLWHQSGRDGRKVYVHEIGLSEHGGEQDLYFYADDQTGASLLRPLSRVVEERGEPVTTAIQTSTLAAQIAATQANQIDFVKLDIQGAELSVLRGAGPAYLNALLGCELEIGLPGSYEGQSSLEETQAELETYGLELFDIRPARVASECQSHVPAKWRESSGQSQRISEVDALFLRTPQSLQCDAATYARYIVLLATYGYFVEAGNACAQGGKTGAFSDEQTNTVMSALDSWICRGFRDLRSYSRSKRRVTQSWDLIRPSPIVASGRTLWRWSSD